MGRVKAAVLIPMEPETLNANAMGQTFALASSYHIMFTSASTNVSQEEKNEIKNILPKILKQINYTVQYRIFN